MADFSKRIANLSPEHQALLKQRLKKKMLEQLNPDDFSKGFGDTISYTPLKTEDIPVASENQKRNKEIQFSLFFFSIDGSEVVDAGASYHLLLESAKFADRHGFHAVWTPERHFAIYPSPSVLGAALAVVTESIQIRAGSVVLPLHNPIQVAEEWAVIDNLSKGRVGISLASGWHPTDFVLSPETFTNRKEVMFSRIQTIQKLWGGEKVKCRSGDGTDVEVRLSPRPLQPKLPIWITASGSPNTWVKAGEIGTNVLTALLNGPDVNFKDLAHKIVLYRESLAKHGYEPQVGKVTLALHTFIGDDVEAVREKVRLPLCNYLRTHAAVYEKLARTQHLELDVEKLIEDDRDTLISFAFERYFNTSGLFGTLDTCIQVVDRLKEIGVDEIACQIDFGLDVGSVIESLHYLNELRKHSTSDELL